MLALRRALVLLFLLLLLLFALLGEGVRARLGLADRRLADDRRGRVLLLEPILEDVFDVARRGRRRRLGGRGVVLGGAIGRRVGVGRGFVVGLGRRVGGLWTLAKLLFLFLLVLLVGRVARLGGVLVRSRVPRRRRRVGRRLLRRGLVHEALGLEQFVERVELFLLELLALLLRELLVRLGLVALLGRRGRRVALRRRSGGPGERNRRRRLVAASG
mmetsp:Transcript_24905/g.98910  ORF Transcript_24905/g.98910 Transcript_24905/m.98910 type:complete len:216 (-) Transcript_24905:54-701(-)